MNGHFLLRDGNWQVQKKAKTTAKNSILKILMKKNMRDAGAYTIGQDEKSSIVYGMPKVAFEEGAVCEQQPLNKIAARLMELIS